MPEFTFGQVEAILAGLHEIADHKRSAFGGRLKNLQSNGIPDRERSGRGRAGSYSFSQLMQLAVGVELLQCGIQPQPAAEVVATNWTKMRPAISFGASNISGHNENYFWLVQLSAFGDMQTTLLGKRHTFKEYHVGNCDDDHDGLFMLANQLMERRGSVGICGSTIGRDVALRCAHYAAVEDMASEVATEIEEFEFLKDRYEALFKTEASTLFTDESRRELARSIVAGRAALLYGNRGYEPDFGYEHSMLVGDCVSRTEGLSAAAKSFLLSADSDPMPLRAPLFSELLSRGLLSAEGDSFGLSLDGQAAIAELKSSSSK